MRGIVGRAFALAAALATAPLVLLAAFAVWVQDRKSPFYLPARVGLGGAMFRLYKLRSMVVDADRTEIDTTVAGDPRVTPVGRLIRRLKLDELPQFWNVVLGDMAVVGPRPNVQRETELYTDEERRLLSVKPGITDLSSIVFSDLAEILAGAQDANIAYNQLVRPWKSRLALFYVDHASARLDVAVVWLTALSLVCRRCSLQGVANLLRRDGAPQDLVDVVRRGRSLQPAPPPGASEIVTSRKTR